MTLLGKKFILALGLCVLAACSEDATGLGDVPDSAVEQGVRFQAVASEGTEARQVNVQLELLNTGSAARDLLWNNCGIEVRLYRGGSLAYDSRVVDPCEDIGHFAVAHPSQPQVLTETIPIANSLGSGVYEAVVVFNGRIDNAPVEVEVRGGTVEL